MKYDIIVYLTDGSTGTLSVEYERDYELRRDVTNIGINGFLRKLENKYLYFPSHKIEKIEVIEVDI